MIKGAAVKDNVAVSSAVDVELLRLKYEDSGVLFDSTVKSGWIALSAVLK